MILQALAAYYDRLANEDGSDIAPEGFEQREIPFLIVLSQQGEFRGLQDTREGEGKKKRGRVFMVPKGVKKTSGIASNLLWDTPNYVLGRPKPDSKKDATEVLARAREQHKLFITTIKENFTEPLQDAGIRAVIAFLEQGDFAAVISDSQWSEIEETGVNITFKIEGDYNLVCQCSAVADMITDGRGSGCSAERQMCLVTGEEDVPVRLHSSIKGVRGAQTSGANIVSFNLDAFASFGKEQGFNAPVGEKAEFAYTTALNRMLGRDSRQKIQVGDATTVFWAEKKSALEDVFASIFGEPAKGEPEQDYKSLVALIRSPESGARVELDPATKFYVLGLSPNAARIAVRFWYAGTVGGLAHNIGQHFDDLEMVKSPNDWHTVRLRDLLRSTALLEKDDNIAPNLVGDTMKAVLTGAPYPRTLLASVISRIRAEQSRKDSNGKPIQNVTYTRAALIKAVLAREARYYKRNEKEVGMSLDTTYASPGYLLGRLFSVLERAQESASPGINATIRDRFYGAASCTPVAVFPHLMKLKNHHIAKLENKGQAVNLERQIGEIIGNLDANNAFPPHLSLQEQGRFAVGYYHQRQDFFTKKG